jgi:hypothetical protein
MTNQESVQSAIQELGLERSIVFEAQNRVVALVGWRSERNPDGDLLTVQITTDREVNLISVQVLGALHAPPDKTDHERLCQLLQAISYLNYRLAVVKIGYDPKDGEIRFSVEAPIVAGEQAKGCIQESIKAAIAGVEQYKQELRRIQDGEQTFQEFYEKLQKSGEESSHEREIPEQERRRIMANILRCLADFIEGSAEETEKTEKAE